MNITCTKKKKINQRNLSAATSYCCEELERTQVEPGEDPAF